MNGANRTLWPCRRRPSEICAMSLLARANRSADYAMSPVQGRARPRLPFVKDLVAGRRGVCEKKRVPFRVRPAMTLESLQNLIAVALGFAIAGSFATGY